MADRRILAMLVARADGAHDDLAGVESDTYFDRQITGFAEARRIPAHLALHSKRSVKSAMGVVLASDRGSKEGENAIARRLHDVALVVMDRVDHETQGRIYERPRLLRIELLHQIHGALDVGEQCGHSLALALERFRRGSLRSHTNLRLWSRGQRGRWCGGSLQASATLPAKLEECRIIESALCTSITQRC